MSTGLNAVECVLWDMDGTLVDTDPYWLHIHRTLVEDHGGVWSEQLGADLTGQSMENTTRLMQEAGADVDLETVVREEYAHLVESVKQETVFRPGALELLSELNEAGIPCALVTASKKILADAIIEQCPPDSFQVVVTEESVEEKKPAPAPYREAFVQIQHRFPEVEAAQTVAIEDSIPGITSASRAGFHVIAVEHVADLTVFDDNPSITQLSTLAGVTVQKLAELAASEGPDR